MLLQASYTWSKLITNINSPEAGGGISAPGNVLSGGASSNDPLDFTQQYGLAAFNRPQRLVIAYSYDLPYHHTEGLSGKLLGGWTVSGVTTIQDGEPFTVIDGNGGTIFGAGGFGGGGVRAELNPGFNGKCNNLGVCDGTNLATQEAITIASWRSLDATCGERLDQPQCLRQHRRVPATECGAFALRAHRASAAQLQATA